jgi:hypothetical protein
MNMRNYEELKRLLIQIKDNNYDVPEGMDADDIISDMLKFIGHTDAELRDELIYTTFVQWAEEKGVISPEKMKEILDICLGNSHLFFGIGEKDTDSVFTRAFSSLVIAVAFCVQDENPFLTADEICGIKEVVLRYISQEKDYRGYVDGKGWAHAVAHIADALANIAGCDKAISVDDEYCISRDGLLEILQAVKTLVCNKDCVYAAEEDERLAGASMFVIYREVLTIDEIINWIDSFGAAEGMNWKGSIPADYYLHVNRKHFMRSLYFKLLSDKDYEKICKHMLGFLVESDD